MQLIIKLTTACNMNCCYCSEGDQSPEQIDKSLLYKIIDDLPELLEAEGEKKIDLLWHGGEPFLAGADFMHDVMNYAEEKLAVYELAFMMQSNGILLDDKWINVLKEHHVKVGISLDGYKELHDANRKTKQGEPTFNLIMDNINKLQENNIFGGCLMVLNTAEQIDVDRLFDFIQSSEFHLKIHSVVPCGRAKNEAMVDEISDNYVELLKNLYRKSMQFESTKDIYPLSDYLNAMINGTKMSECSHNGSCGKRFLCIFSNGDAGFCGRARSENEILGFGNIRNQSLKEIYYSANAEKIRARVDYLKEHDCKNCEVWEYCMGGCSFEAVNQFGCLYQKSPFCKQTKDIMHFLQTEGLDLMKKRLAGEKKKYREQIKIKRKLLEDLKHAR